MIPCLSETLIKFGTSAFSKYLETFYSIVIETKIIYWKLKRTNFYYLQARLVLAGF